MLQGGRSGWVRADVLVARSRRLGRRSGARRLRGRQRARRAPRAAPPRRARASRIGRRASGRRVVDERDVYLRYAARSTAFSYLDRGDVVALHWRGVTYVCVEVVASAHAPEGARGWVASGALRAP